MPLDVNKNIASDDQVVITGIEPLYFYLSTWLHNFAIFSVEAFRT